MLINLLQLKKYLKVNLNEITKKTIQINTTTKYIKIVFY